MYRDRKQILSTEIHNFVLNHAALGDMLTSLPAIVYARQFYTPDLKLRVWLPAWHMDLVAHLLAPYGEFELRDFATFPRKFDDRKQADLGPISYNAAIFDQHTRCRVHMVDYAFNFLLNARPESMEQRSYVTKAPLGPRPYLPWTDGSAGPWHAQAYVVFPVGATSDNKLFRASVMGPIMQWCLDRGYRVVIVGTKTSHTHTKVDGELKAVTIREQTDLLPPGVFKHCVDMRERTTLLELRDVLGHAAAVVGVDGGTMHLAGTTDVPIIFASGTTLPKHRYIARHGSHTYKIRYVGPRNLECYGCQSNWPLTTLHFTKCVYGDNACMEQLHPDDFINGLRELGL
jgi:ADP-heptose:LPS heptosyltransferase